MFEQKRVRLTDEVDCLLLIGIAERTSSGRSTEKNYITIILYKIVIM